MIYTVKINGYSYYADNARRLIGLNPNEITQKYEHLTDNERQQIFDCIRWNPVIYDEKNYI